MSITEEFDGPVIEPVKGYGDVKFARMTMADWSSWGAALKAKRAKQLADEVNKMMGLNAAAKAELLARAQSVDVQMYELLNQQYTPDGIGKLLKDGYQRAGGDMTKWDAIAKRIPPSRQQAIASDICSEPKPTVDELRDSLRELLKKAGKPVPAGIDTMGDEELIRAAQEFQPQEPESSELPLSETPGDSAPGALTTSSEEAVT